MRFILSLAILTTCAMCAPAPINSGRLSLISFIRNFQLIFIVQAVKQPSQVSTKTLKSFTPTTAAKQPSPAPTKMRKSFTPIIEGLVWESMWCTSLKVLAVRCREVKFNSSTRSIRIDKINSVGLPVLMRVLRSSNDDTHVLSGTPLPSRVVRSHPVLAQPSLDPGGSSNDGAETRGAITRSS
ncbi:hypothetical protein F5Y05DRAFT_189031 [Hypoxylon sp. FL0543]|nr:hypothetical protein F5Y05DRAFT_189031 [Hypoxylon sp. FL0543]